MDAEETVSLTIGGIDYKLGCELTGRQYLELRRHSLVRERTGDGSGHVDPNALTSRVDEAEFEVQNLYFRLREPKFESVDEMVNSMGRKALQVLSLAAIKLDNKEAGDVVDFLQENSALFGQSVLDSLPSSDSPPATSEALSE